MNLSIDPLTTNDIAAADRIFRVAFGTRNGLAEPTSFGGDAALIKTRCLSEPVITLGARVDGVLVASILATVWGKFAWIGPLSVQPDYWDKGIGQRLLETTIPTLERLGSRHIALFTIGESTKHVALYRKFGFWPQFLTILTQRNVTTPQGVRCYVTYSGATDQERRDYLDSCRDLTSLLYDGLDVSQEIITLHRQALGDTILILEQSKVAAFAVCHSGAGTEAGSGTTYIKFAAVSPGPRAPAMFELLFTELERLAAALGMTRLVAGVNTARRGAYARMIDRGFRSIQQGVAMHRPDEAAYDRPDAYVIDDLR